MSRGARAEVAPLRLLDDTFVPGPYHKINLVFSDSPIAPWLAHRIPPPQTRSERMWLHFRHVCELGRNAKCSALAADFLLSGDMSHSEVGVMG
jgi:hypothetical protein